MITKTVPYAECMLLLARGVLASQSRLILCEQGWDSSRVAVVKKALDLYQRPGLMLKALVEDWDDERITRELY